MRDRKCTRCNRAAWFRCDAVLTDAEAARLGRPAGSTCDAPLCWDHATRAGTRATVDRLLGSTYTDSIDYCPDHAAQRTAGT